MLTHENESRSGHKQPNRIIVLQCTSNPRSTLCRIFQFHSNLDQICLWNHWTNVLGDKRLKFSVRLNRDEYIRKYMDSKALLAIELFEFASRFAHNSFKTDSVYFRIKSSADHACSMWPQHISVHRNKPDQLMTEMLIAFTTSALCLCIDHIEYNARFIAICWSETSNKWVTNYLTVDVRIIGGCWTCCNSIIALMGRKVRFA